MKDVIFEFSNVTGSDDVSPHSVHPNADQPAKAKPAQQGPQQPLAAGQPDPANDVAEGQYQAYWSM